MSILLVSDLHFENRTAFNHPLKDIEFHGCNSRFHYIAKAFRAAITTAVKQDCEAVVLCGDIFHSRGHISVPVYNAVYRLFHEAAQKIKLIVYTGNHDLVDLKGNYSDKGLHSLLVYEEKIILVDKPELVSLDNFDLCIVPYNYKAAETISAANKLFDTFTSEQRKDVKIGLFHHSFDGAKSGPWEWQMPELLKVSDLPKFTLSFSGHLHMHQSVENLIYVGSLLQHDQGERNYKPGCVLVNDDCTWKFIPNNSSPKFNLVETNDIEELSDLEGYVTVRWQGDSSEIKQIKEKLPYAKVETKPDSLTQKKRIEINTDSSVPDMLKKYLKYKTGLVDKQYLDLGVALYEGTI